MKKLFLLIPAIVFLFLFSNIFSKQPKQLPSSNEAFIKDTSTHNKYAWLSKYYAAQNIINRINLPSGYKRIKYEKKSFADWLQHLPLKAGNPQVLLYNGNLKGNQEAHYAVIDIDTGTEDLQQCADAVMRLRAEYFYSLKEFEKIHFKFTSGDHAEYARWIEGYRPSIKGNQVSWKKTASKDHSYKNFKAFMKQVFNYAGTSSLSKEMAAKDIPQIETGDVFIKGGFPGHAVIVVDMAINEKTGEKIFLLAQSYMPAQDIQLLKNPIEDRLNPWYSIGFGENLKTPEWTFQKNELKKFN